MAVILTLCAAIVTGMQLSAYARRTWTSEGHMREGVCADSSSIGAMDMSTNSQTPLYRLDSIQLQHGLSHMPQKQKQPQHCLPVQGQGLAHNHDYNHTLNQDVHSAEDQHQSKDPASTVAGAFGAEQESRLRTRGQYHNSRQ